MSQENSRKKRKTSKVTVNNDIEDATGGAERYGSEEKICTLLECVDDGDDHHLICGDCKKKVHYRCTELPYYELDRYVTKPGNRVYKCRGCANVSKRLQEIMSRYPNKALTQCKEVEELAIIMQGMKLDSKMNGNWKEELTKDRERANKLAEQVKICERMIKEHEENELQLKSQVSILQKEIDTHKAQFKFNPDFHLIENLETTIHDRLSRLGEDLKKELLDTLTKSMHEIRDENNKVAEDIKDVSKTYAETVKKNIQISSTIPTQIENANNLRVEENEQKKRALNVIVHGVAEFTGRDDEKEKHDRKFLKDLFDTLDRGLKFKSFSRIGTDESKKRPIKVSMNNEADKKMFMRSLSLLKDHEDFVGISITDDYTQSEREIIKKWRENAKIESDKLGKNAEYLIVARGNPKNRMFYKKIRKRRQGAQS